MRRVLSVDDHVDGVLAGDRTVLARTITLVESNAEAHRAQAAEVLTRLLPHAGGAHRVGISGVPGVGKSTFLETLGMRLVEAGRKVAVLAVDPSSDRTGGSILGDKTRMSKLSVHDRAFVRPSPTGGTLGGVHRKSRESLRVLEAAGFDVVFVETVGVGQSEITVAEMVDTFLLLLLTGAGDDLQGIKRGILEVADVLVVNKADGDNVVPAARARQQLEGALHFMTARHATWTPPVLTASGLSGEGMDAVWDAVVAHHEALVASGDLGGQRAEQRLRWLWSMAREEVLHRFRTDPDVAGIVDDVEAAVREDRLTPAAGVAKLLDAADGSGA